jgi:hypothetical protein
MKIIVTGGRHFEPLRVIEWLDENFHRTFPEAATIIHGACGLQYGEMKGADRGADDWCRLRGFPCVRYPAIPGEEQIRNFLMIRDHAPIGGAIAFAGNQGTRNCIVHLKKFGVEPVYVGW